MAYHDLEDAWLLPPIFITKPKKLNDNQESKNDDYLINIHNTLPINSNIYSSSSGCDFYPLKEKINHLKLLEKHKSLDDIDLTYQWDQELMLENIEKVTLTKTSEQSNFIGIVFLTAIYLLWFLIISSMAILISLVGFVVDKIVNPPQKTYVSMSTFTEAFFDD